MIDQLRAELAVEKEKRRISLGYISLLTSHLDALRKETPTVCGVLALGKLSEWAHAALKEA